jgi:hypothetical protein
MPELLWRLLLELLGGTLDGAGLWTVGPRGRRCVDREILRRRITRDSLAVEQAVESHVLHDGRVNVGQLVVGHQVGVEHVVARWNERWVEAEAGWRPKVARMRQIVRHWQAHGKVR